MRVTRASIALAGLLLSACPTPPSASDADVPDAAVDAGPDAGRDAGRRRDAGPRPVRLPDAGCPPVDQGALGLLSFEATFTAGSIIADEVGGAWVAGRDPVSGAVQVLAMDSPTEVRLAVELPGPDAVQSGDAVQSALGPGGGVWLAWVTPTGGLGVAGIDGEGVALWVRTLRVPESVGRFIGAPRLAADESGPVVVGGITAGTALPTAAHVAAFDALGALRFERRLESGGITVPTALAADEGELLLAIRSDAFTERVVTVAGIARSASAPWLIGFDEGGEVTFQIAIDAPIGSDLSLDVATRDGDWVLAGGTDRAFEMAWVVHLTGGGSVRAGTLLDDVSNNRITAIRPAGDAVRLFQAGPDHVAVSRSGQDPGTVQRAIYRGGSGSYALGPLGAWVTGPAPRCGRGTPEHPLLCSGPTPDAVVWRLPGDRLTPCTEGMAAEPWTEQDNEFLLLTAVPTDRESRALATALEAPEVSTAPLAVELQTVCLGPGLCIR